MALDRFYPTLTRVLAEQDGEIERRLKARLSEFFATAGIRCRAYLAQVEYDGQWMSVAMCVRLISGDPEKVEDGMERIFRQMFRGGQHLDCVFFDEEQE